MLALLLAVLPPLLFFFLLLLMLDCLVEWLNSVSELRGLESALRNWSSSVIDEEADGLLGSGCCWWCCCCSGCSAVFFVGDVCIESSEEEAEGVADREALTYRINAYVDPQL